MFAAMRWMLLRSLCPIDAGYDVCWIQLGKLGHQQAVGTRSNMDAGDVPKSLSGTVASNSWAQCNQSLQYYIVLGIGMYWGFATVTMLPGYSSCGGCREGNKTDAWRPAHDTQAHTLCYFFSQWST